jgi:glycosyltransferase involved in cell wall biosynthesis
MLTVLIPTKNHGHYLEELITNVIFAEKSPVSKLMICNDASTDDTANILKKFDGNKNIRVFENAVSIGAVAAQNVMFPHIETPYVLCIASDDYFFPEQISKLFDEMRKRDAYIGFGKYLILEGDQTTELSHPGWQARNVAGADEFCTLLSKDLYIFSGATIFKTDFLPRQGPERTPYDMFLSKLVSADGLGDFRGLDWDIALKMATDHPEKFYFLDEYCACFRKVAAQLSSSEIYNDTGRGAFEMALLILKYLPNYPLRKRVKDSDAYRTAIQNLFYAKCGQITETAKQSHNFQEIYKPVLLTADALLNNM